MQVVSTPPFSPVSPLFPLVSPSFPPYYRKFGKSDSFGMKPIDPFSCIISRTRH